MKRSANILAALTAGAIFVIAYFTTPPPGPAHAEAAIFNVYTGQISVTSTATRIVRSRPGRFDVIIEQLSANADLYCGSTANGHGAVTTGNGMLLPGVKGANIALHTSAEIYCISVGATAVVSYAEDF